MYANIVKAIVNMTEADFNGAAQERAEDCGKAFSTIHDRYSFTTLQTWDDFIGKLSADELYEFSIGSYETGNVIWYECQRAITEALFGIRM